MKSWCYETPGKAERKLENLYVLNESEKKRIDKGVFVRILWIPFLFQGFELNKNVLISTFCGDFQRSEKSSLFTVYQGILFFFSLCDIFGSFFSNLTLLKFFSKGVRCQLFGETSSRLNQASCWCEQISKILACCGAINAENVENMEIISKKSFAHCVNKL